jgi:undecaprenyl-diphosphatase
MTPLQALILGIVEGITEYLPVSSTGHLILVSRALGLADTAANKASIDAFNIVVQGAAIAAVAGLYWREVIAMLRAVPATLLPIRKGPDHAKAARLARNLFISFLPAAVLGLLIDEWVEERFFRAAPVLAALALGGILMIALGPWVRRKAQNATETGLDGSTLSAWAAFGIGALQCVALIPGTSRSLMTILGALIVGLAPREAARYSFLLALPTLGGACAYKSLALAKNGAMIEQLGGWWSISVGLVAAFVSAALSVAWLVGFLGRGGFALFGWWRIGLAGAVALALVMGWVTL